MVPADVRTKARHIYMAYDPRYPSPDWAFEDEINATDDRELAQKWSNKGWIVFEYGIVDWIKPNETSTS